VGFVSEAHTVDELRKAAQIIGERIP
jgi:hypothetical protein